MKNKIAFIGAGKMATAIVKGLIKNKVYSPDSIICTCGNDSTGTLLANETGIIFTNSFEPYLKNVGVLVLACKPQQIDQIDLSLFQNNDKTADLTVLSILAGTTISRLRMYFKDSKYIIRTMPNTPGQIGSGSTAFASSIDLDKETLSHLKKILGSLGTIYEVKESEMDAITALSGSGPAYVFEFISALSEGGINAGLDPVIAKKLAIETVIGSAKLLDESELESEDLRDAVTSKGGTTEAALKVLKYGGFKKLLIDAILEAKEHSLKLSQG